MDMGRHLAQRCDACSARFWMDTPKRLKTCPRCESPLRDVEERRQHWASGFPTRQDADSELRKLLQRLDRGGDPFPKNMTLREYCEKWLDHQRSRIRPRTWERYSSILGMHVMPEIGAVRLAKLRPAHIQSVLDRVVSSGRSHQTALHVYRVLSNALHQAVRWQLLGANPAAPVQPPRPERLDLAVPKPEELLLLVEAAKGTKWEIPVLVAATTGARRSEVLGIRWADMDLEAGRLRIVQSLQKVPDGAGGEALRFAGVKTQRARREVALPGFAVGRLQRHKADQAKRRLELGPEWQDLDLVCDRGDGGPIDPGNLTHGFKAVVKRAGLSPKMRLHDVRHGVATALLGEGVHPAIASALLGHASPAFTMSRYQHMLDQMTVQAAAALDRAFNVEGS